MKTYYQLFARGYDKGYEVATNCEMEEGVELVDSAVEAEQNSRSFSPFEFLAKEINEREDFEEAWDHYESGVSSGIAVGVADRTKNEKLLKGK